MRADAVRCVSMRADAIDAVISHTAQRHHITLNIKNMDTSIFMNVWTPAELNPDKYFMEKPSQDYGVSLKYGVTLFYFLQPNVSEHIPP